MSSNHVTLNHHYDHFQNDELAVSRFKAYSIAPAVETWRDEEIIFSLFVFARALFPAVCTRIGGDTVIGYDDIGMASREGVDRQGRPLSAWDIHE